MALFNSWEKETISFTDVIPISYKKKKKGDYSEIKGVICVSEFYFLRWYHIIMEKLPLKRREESNRSHTRDSFEFI